MKEYQDEGIAFQYPPAWELSEDRCDAGICISVTDGGTAFWSITLLFDRPPLKAVLEETLKSFEEYQELETEALEAEVAGFPARGCDLGFVCYDLLNTAKIRIFRTGRFTAVVLSQAMDEEVEQQAIFDAINDSLDCRRDGNIRIE